MLQKSIGRKYIRKIKTPEIGRNMICDYCINYIYDEDVEGYICDVDMDEDDYARMRSSEYSTCPYYRSNDDYLIVRKQM